MDRPEPQEQRPEPRLAAVGPHTQPGCPARAPPQGAHPWAGAPAPLGARLGSGQLGGQAGGGAKAAAGTGLDVKLSG